jgi:hypothetical protein
VTTSHSVRRLLALLYLAGAILIVDQVADLIGSFLAQPVALGSAAWRFGAFGLISSRSSVFFVADAMIFAAALGLEHRRVLRALGFLHVLLAIAVAAGLAVFGLDALEVRRGLRESASGLYNSAAVRVGAVALLGGILMAWAGVVAITTTRSGARRGAREGLVVGPRGPGNEER